MGGGRRRITAAEKEVSLEKLKSEYRSEGHDLSTLKKAYEDYVKARTFLVRHRNENHPRASEYQRLLESTKVLSDKYKKLDNMERNVATKRREEQENPHLLEGREAKRAKNDSKTASDDEMAQAESERQPKSSIACPSEDVLLSVKR